MDFMFYACSLLTELNLSNINTNNVTNISYMLLGYSNDLKMKINKKIRISEMKLLINYD